MAPPNSIEEILAPFFSAENIITKPISTLSALFFVYGIYCMVFALSISTLWQQERAHKLHKWGSIALFTLATLYTITYAWGTLNQTFIAFRAATTKDYPPMIRYLSGDTKKSAWVGLTDFSSTLMNIIADVMLIHRCYVIYDYNIKILYSLAFVAIVLNGIDFGSVIAAVIAVGDSSKHFDPSLSQKAMPINSAAMIGIVIFQIVLSFMTGGRIWWITREARKLTTTRSSTMQFSNIVAIVIESAFLYAFTLLFAVVLQNFIWDPEANGVQPFAFDVIAIPMSGLAPTMIIARVAYGKSVDSVKQRLSTFQTASPENSQQEFVATRQRASGFRLHATNSREEATLLGAAEEKV